MNAKVPLNETLPDNSLFRLTSESTLRQNYQQHIEPFWQQQVRQRQLEGTAKIPLHVTSVQAPDSKGTIVFSAGRTEGAIKYKELFFNLYQNGYSVYSVDHRGQGLSGRMTQNPEKGHVETYQDYVQDMHLFYTRIVASESSHQPVLLCHSMGSAIGAAYNLQYPDHFAKAIYASPMFAINAPVPVWLAKLALTTELLLNRLFRAEPWYFIGQRDYRPEAFEHNRVTHSEVRYSLSNQALDEAGVQLGGVTSQWLAASLEVMADIEQQASRLSQPTLILQAGGDTVVGNDIQQRICASMPNCRLTCITGARHELLMEQDLFRNQAMSEIFHFIQSKES